MRKPHYFLSATPGSRQRLRIVHTASNEALISTEEDNRGSRHIFLSAADARRLAELLLEMVPPARYHVVESEDFAGWWDVVDDENAGLPVGIFDLRADADEFAAAKNGGAS